MGHCDSIAPFEKEAEAGCEIAFFWGDPRSSILSTRSYLLVSSDYGEPFLVKSIDLFFGPIVGRNQLLKMKVDNFHGANYTAEKP